MNPFLSILLGVAENPVFENAALGLLSSIAGQLFNSAHDPAKVKEIASSIATGAPAIVGAIVKGTTVEKEATFAASMFSQFINSVAKPGASAMHVGGSSVIDKAGGNTGL